MTRKGKIARLPRDVRDELNQRIENGEPGKDLVAWLNGLPEVKRVLAAYFGGREITEQNLSEWKGGGHLDWQKQEEERERASEFSADAEKLADSTDGGLTGHLTTVLAVRYADTLANWNGEVTPEFRRKLQALRTLRQDLVALRQTDLNEIRMEMEQTRFEWEEEIADDELQKRVLATKEFLMEKRVGYRDLMNLLKGSMPSKEGQVSPKKSK